jgi:putative glutamine amidotransferase
MQKVQTRFVTSLGYFQVSKMFDYPNITLGYEDADFNFLPTDILVLEGGTDVNPKLYGEERQPYTSQPDTQRDIFEEVLWSNAVEAGAGVLGICRGAQFGCVMNGGKLVQHIHGHGNSHMIMTDTGEQVFVTSTHHQCMNPTGMRHKLVGWCEFDEVPEIVFFPDTKTLCIQGHPEFTHHDSEFVKYCDKLIKQYLVKE